MGVRLLYCNEVDKPNARHADVVLFDSVTGWAFGPVIKSATFGSETVASLERAEAFLRFLPADARAYSGSELEERWAAFLEREPEIHAEDERAEIETRLNGLRSTVSNLEARLLELAPADGD